MFPELALEKLLQIAPELSNFIVTFNDISDSLNKGDESDVLVGLFTVQFGSGYYYIPVIAKGESIQPIDSIFNIEDQTFSPLTKGFIQSAVNSSSLTMGKATKVPPTVNGNPSVYDLVVPPRTGKYVYSSSSRLGEFLAIMPEMMKSAMLKKFSEDKEIYSALHRLFGLEGILASLKPTPRPIVAQLKPAVEIITKGTGLDNPTIKSILDKGYALRGENTTERVAVLASDFSDAGMFKQISNTDAGQDYEVIYHDSSVRSAFIPKRCKSAPQFSALLYPAKGVSPVFALFNNGDYSITSNLIVKGEGCDNHNVLKDVLNNSQAITPSQVTNYTDILILSPEMEYVGAFYCQNVFINSDGVVIKATNMLSLRELPVNGEACYSQSDAIIYALRNCKTIDASNPKSIFIPINSLIIPLKKNITFLVETNINAAMIKTELATLSTLGTAADIGYDGIEFTYNQKVVGPEVKLIELLVVKEGVSPDKAESFIKKAKENRKIKIYLSKRADFEPGEIPQFGDPPPEQYNPFDLQNGPGPMFINNMKNSLLSNDAQTVEATIISELLQVANSKEYIREYLPDIKTAIDKLGRTLLLTRLNISELAKTHTANELVSFISNLRNVYRLLGDNYIKLGQLVSDAENFVEDQAK